MNNGGISRPLGNFVPGSLNSSKNVCAHACKGVILADGVYSSNLDTETIRYSLLKITPIAPGGGQNAGKATIAVFF